MKENFEFALEHVLVHEGGWADHPSDPGGATMKGVTLDTFRRHFGSSKTKDDLRNISDSHLAHIYKTGYWDKCKCDDLPFGVDYAVFDAAVNSGPSRASKWLQAVVGASQDGRVGPATLARVLENDAKITIEKMLERRLRFLQGLSTWPTFGRGWGRRVEGVRVLALQVAGGNGDSESPMPSMEFEVVREGSRGEWVKKLQEVLGIEVDGVFGIVTRDALVAWQKRNGLEADGIAGRITYRTMGLIGLPG